MLSGQVYVIQEESKKTYGRSEKVIDALHGQAQSSATDLRWRTVSMIE